MKKGTSFIILCLTTVSVLHFDYSRAQSKGNVNLEEAKEAIAESNALYFQAYVKDDVSLLTKQYAEDCWIMAPNASALCGPDAPPDFFRITYHQLGIRNGKLMTIDVYGISEDIVAEIGFWKLYDADNIEFKDGEYLVLWKKTSNGWKRWRDSFTNRRK
jgi:ketosteroid isomerase-like protein